MKPVYLAVCVNNTAICERKRRSEFKNRKLKHAKGRYGSLLNFNLFIGSSSVAIDVFSKRPSNFVLCTSIHVPVYK